MTLTKDFIEYAEEENKKAMIELKANGKRVLKLYNEFKKGI